MEIRDVVIEMAKREIEDVSNSIRELLRGGRREM
jgi:hypothetical protein